MSTTPTTSSAITTSQTGYLLGNLGGTVQVTGLASGLNTDQIISEEMAIYNQPLVALQNQQTTLTDTNTQLTSIQTALQTLAADAQALGDPSLFDTSQTVTSSDPTLVTGTTTSGAAVGGYQVSVTQLANAASRTYTFSSPSAAGTITIDGQSVSVSAGESISSLVASINSNGNLDVYAAATNSNTVVLSDRATGQQTGSYIQVSDPTGTLTEQTSLAYAGQNALYSVDGTAGSSASNQVTSAIPGVTLTLSGVTGSNPVTITVGAPAASEANVQAAINTFITQYNSVISQIQTQLSQAPSSSDLSQGTLYQDPSLTSLLASMREAMYTPGSGLPSGLASMLDIGVSTGATTGSGAVSQSALAGDLTLNSATLSSQMASNPSGVQAVLNSWSISFSELVNNEAAPGGTIDQRIQGDDQQISQLGNQITAMQQSLADKQNQLVQEFAQMEAALSQNQSTASWLTSQISQLAPP
ncbi:MAG TPA: flagellar filament capping protein FliD [Solirubrobacteraceae bacterium]|nr:flagellar filament capping protein FliD [Solirubrobacteraceae bacterium]